MPGHSVSLMDSAANAPESLRVAPLPRPQEGGFSFIGPRGPLPIGDAAVTREQGYLGMVQQHMNGRPQLGAPRAKTSCEFQKGSRASWCLHENRNSHGHPCTLSDIL